MGRTTRWFASEDDLHAWHKRVYYLPSNTYILKSVHEYRFFNSDVWLHHDDRHRIKILYRELEKIGDVECPCIALYIMRILQYYEFVIFNVDGTKDVSKDVYMAITSQNVGVKETGKPGTENGSYILTCLGIRPEKIKINIKRTRNIKQVINILRQYDNRYNDIISFIESREQPITNIFNQTKISQTKLYKSVYIYNNKILKMCKIERSPKFTKNKNLHTMDVDEVDGIVDDVQQKQCYKSLHRGRIGRLHVDLFKRVSDIEEKCKADISKFPIYSRKDILNIDVKDHVKSFLSINILNKKMTVTSKYFVEIEDRQCVKDMMSIYVFKRLDILLRPRYLSEANLVSYFNKCVYPSQLKNKNLLINRTLDKVRNNCMNDGVLDNNIYNYKVSKRYDWISSLYTESMNNTYCNHSSIRYAFLQLRSSDEGETTISICNNCNITLNIN